MKQLRRFFGLLCLVGSALGGLTKEEAAQVKKEIYQELSASRGIDMRAIEGGFVYFEIEAADQKMRCAGKLYGEAKKGERALYISMHGGGGTQPRVNDQQWINQIGLYVPEEGWYVAPRAPTNTWNLWHEPHIDLLFSKLIEEMVAQHGVDPDRVYLMGFSAGGDGVYQLAPRLADRFGAASMMAGHPNDASADGLHQLPFRIYMGGKDSAYQRNKVAAEWKVKLAKLQKERGGYEHKVTIYPEEGHWMNKKDAEAVPWMGKQTRKAWPKKVIWGKSRIRSERFYWLGGQPKGLIKAEVTGQKIAITGGGGEELTLYLSDELIDLDEALQITLDGKEYFSGTLSRSKEAIQISLKERLDPVMAASVIFKIKPGVLSE